MNCPRCDAAVLDEKTRDGVVIDACPQCRGIWLDRGELEKLISRAMDDDPRPGARDDEHRRWERDRDDDDDDDRGRRGRRGGFLGSLGDLFD
jgi:Zn-finger nucleic acid-binding protein